MDVIIREEASEHIRSKGGHLLIFVARLTGCCAGSVPSPMLELGKPRSSPENYEAREVGGVTVHLARELASRPGWLEVGLSKLLAWKTLTLKTSDELGGEEA